MWWQTVLWALLIPLAVLTWRSRFWGILILLAGLSSYALRTTIGGIPTTWLELGIYIIVIISWWRGDFKSYQNYISKSFWCALALGLWLLSALVGVIIAPSTTLALGILKGWLVDPLLLMIVIWITYVRYDDKLEFWRNCVGALLLGAALTGLVSAVMSEYQDLVRWQRGAASANQLALYLVPVAVSAGGWLVFPYLRDKLSKLWWAWLAAVGWLFVVIYKTDSFVAMAAIILSFIILILVKFGLTQKIVSWFLGLIVVVGLFLPWVNSLNFNSLGLVHNNKLYGISSWDVRQVFWREAKKLIRLKPITGVGLGQWQNIFTQNIQPTIPESRNQGYRLEFYYSSLFPHNLWLTIWLSQGLAGILAILALLVIVINKLWRDNDPFGWVVGTALAALLMQGIFDTPLYKNDLSILFWLLVAMHFYGTVNRSPSRI